jgi:hypothetical protein
MKKLSLLCFVVLGCVLILGAGYIQKSSDLPGDSTTGNNLTEVVGGLNGPCSTNGNNCSGNRICFLESGIAGTCVSTTSSDSNSSAGGDPCGSCSGDEHTTCKNLSGETTPCNESTTSCCEVQSQCHTTADADNPCHCLHTTNKKNIGLRIKCD